ncbi:MAG: MerR family transcriptional regulator, partial [Candidatus Dormibacteraeota bacterium]|nr:MerR family transcriptional regulator [Candidatus Dormibacteraeota bacterium]
MAELTFSIGEVAAMLDISRHTLRAWERRHQMVEPVRTPSGQRRYTGEDVEILRQAKHERRVHGVSMRVAAMTAHGLIVPEALEGRPAGGEPPNGTAGEDPLRGVLNVVPELVIVLDAQGTVTDANTAFVRFCDVLPGRLRGMQFADFVDPFDRAKAVRTYQPSLQQRRDWELNLRGPRRRALFSFDCWPIRWPHETRLVLVGRETG